MKAYFILIITLYFSPKLFCQDISDAEITAEYLKKTNLKLKFSLIDLVDVISPSFTIGVEKEFKNYYSLEVSGGWISSFDGEWIQPNPLTGYRFRIEARKYLLNRRWRAMFIGIQGFYKNMEESVTDDFWRFNNSFIQEIDYELKREAFGGHLMVGYYWLAESGIFMEFGGGFGIRHLERGSSDIPNDAELIDDEGFFFVWEQNGRHVLPSIFGKVAVGYAF